MTRTASFGKTLVFPNNVIPKQGGRVMMMAEYATDGKLGKLLGAAADLFDFVQRSAEKGEAIHEVEGGIWRRMLQMGHEALGQFLERQGDGDLGETLTMPDGHEAKRLEQPHRRCYQSIFGEFQLLRTVYGTREGQQIEFVPLDARLQLPESEFSYVLQDWAQALGVEHAFARTAEVLCMILRLKLPVHSLERMNRKMSESVLDFRASLPAPAAKDEGEILVATADNKGVPMRRPADQLPAGARRKKGEKANKKQMAAVGCVYTVDQKVRTAEDVVVALFREYSSPRRSDDPEPVAQQKRIWSSLSCERDGRFCQAEEEVFSWMADDVGSRHRRGQPLVCVMDGQPSLWAVRKTYLPGDNVVEILDLLHVTPRLWEAAYLFHREGSEEAASFVRDRLLRMLRGEAGYVIGGLRQMGTKHGLRGHRLAKLTTICNYLRKNLARMRYDEYLAAGYPIASGVIEGACRYVVKDRMERAGMRWTVEGAQAMLALRTTHINGQWKDFQKYRIKQERQRLYPQHKWLKQVTWPLAA
jgi:hypothetical protein